MEELHEEEQLQPIELSDLTKNLIYSYNKIYEEKHSYRGDIIEVSATASFFGLLYEKLRNAVEFNEDHLLQREAIARILKRRLISKKSVQENASILVKEMLWGGYAKKGTTSSADVINIQKILENYTKLRKIIIENKYIKPSSSFNSYFLNLAACELVEYVNKDFFLGKNVMLYYLYQTTRNKVAIETLDEETLSQYYYIACESSFLKNDKPFIRYHLFTLKFGKISEANDSTLKQIAREFKNHVKTIDSIIKNPYNDRLSRFIRKMQSPYLILHSFIEQNKKDFIAIMKDRTLLYSKIDNICTQKYKETARKLRIAGIRSIIYIFITKMIFVLILEIPLSNFIYKEIHFLSIGINTIIPPVLMGLIVTIITVPSASNNKMMYDRIVDVINKDPSYENKVALHIKRKPIEKRPILKMIFTIFYVVVFGLVFILLYAFLDLLNFNLISKGIFIFFVSVVTFFGYRVRLISKEYVLEPKGSVLSPLVDLIFLPILSVGKIFSGQLSKINVFMFVFDVLIEAPYKLIVEVFEEWIKFTRGRKDEIA